MAETPKNAQDVYELLENDTGDIMVLIFGDEQMPESPSFYLDEQNKLIELTRNPNSAVLIEGLQPESIEKLRNITKLYVCEMQYNENPDEENKILYAYAARLKKKDLSEPKAKEKQSRQESLSEKARLARENILNKKNSPQ